VGLVYLSMIVPLVAIIHELCRKFDVILMWIGLFDKIDYFDQIVLPMTFFGFSLAAFFAPLAALAMHDLPARRLIRAAEELALLRTVAGSMGITLLGVVQFRRTPFHQLDLADHFGGRRFASLDLLSEFSDRLQASGFSANMARSQLGSFIRQEASLLALNDAFLLGAFVFVALAVFVWLARSAHETCRQVARGRSRRNDGAG
jgi:MFS transporter, DHA2 family, multidrug resistance protein